jgi:hypothetical protein
MDEPLDFVDRVRLRLHLRICGNCAQVEQQLAALKSAGDELFAQGLGDEPAPRA